MSLLNIVPEVTELIDQGLQDGEIYNILNSPTLPGPVDTKNILGYLQAVGKWGKIKLRSSKPYSDNPEENSLTELCINLVDALQELDYIHFEDPSYQAAISYMIGLLKEAGFITDQDELAILSMAENKWSLAEAKLKTRISFNDISDIRHGRY